MKSKNWEYLKTLRHEFGILEGRAPLLLIMGGVFMSLLELLGVSAVFPLIMVILDPSIIQRNDALQWVYTALKMEEPRQIVALMGIIIAAVFIFKGVFNIMYWRYEFRTLAVWRIKIAHTLYNAYSSTSYSFFNQKNSADIITAITSSIPDIVNNFLHQIINLTNYIIAAIVLILYIIYLNWIVALIVMAVGGTLLYTHNRVQKKSLQALGQEIIEHKRRQYSLLQQSFAGFKETRLHNKEMYFAEKYLNTSKNLSKAEQKFLFYRSVPTATVEMSVMIAIISVFIALIYIDNNLHTIAAQLGVMAMAAFRLIPLINRSITAFIMIHTGQYAMNKVMAEYGQLESQEREKPHQSENTVVSFQNEIIIQDASYAYPNSDQDVLCNVNISISAGQFIGITGPSGGGKSTLVHILLGFITDFKGVLRVDNHPISSENIKGLRKFIGFVDQNIFIIDASIAENVAFGIDPDKIDREKVRESLTKAQLWDYVSSLKSGMDTQVGELGRNLSGGQKQRLGIARALYRDIKILILDEASSALDVETEYNFFNFLETLKGEITVITIAHRLSTLKGCDKVYFIDGGKIIDNGNFSNLYHRNHKFKNFIDYSQIEIDQNDR